MTKKTPKYVAGQVIEVANYPFVRTVFEGYDIIDGQYQDEGWRPGCNKESGDDFVDFVADGLGVMLLEVVQVVSLPGGFAPRVFYVRRWRDPDGKVFGRRQCRVTTVGSFTKQAKGYRYDFYLGDDIIHPTAGVIQGFRSGEL